MIKSNKTVRFNLIFFSILILTLIFSNLSLRNPIITDVNADDSPGPTIGAIFDDLIDKSKNIDCGCNPSPTTIVPTPTETYPTPTECKVTSTITEMPTPTEIEPTTPILKPDPTATPTSILTPTQTPTPT